MTEYHEIFRLNRKKERKKERIYHVEKGRIRKEEIMTERKTNEDKENDKIKEKKN